jgi:dTMP kinase
LTVPLVVLEGIDGCGKSTQAELLVARLAARGLTCRKLREPGGTQLGEAVRRLLLDPATEACPAAELFGYLLARAQLCSEILAPALARGEVVVLDRFWHSTVAYQGAGLGLPLDLVRAANRLAVGHLPVAAALWLDLDPAAAEARRSGAADRIEARGLEYLRRVREGYRTLCAEGELVRIDAAQESVAVAAAIWAAVAPALDPA